MRETEKNALSPKTELTNMVMVEDRATGRVLVQQRVKSWTGLSFPGGHVEAGESFVDSAIREVKEETGLDIRNLKSCGVIHWANKDSLDRYIVYLYKTSDFSGELLSETEEGKVFWIAPDELKAQNLSN
ncbi:MAG: 8-oxo-dGTP diphosphatase, partial [Clostridia bacterium]|nr:8-oxo-dGTP diphosphatase [Clostridia bacterium]